MSSNNFVIVHIVDKDEDPRAICNGEPFDISEIEGSGFVRLCEECNLIMLSKIMNSTDVIEGEVIEDAQDHDH